MKKALSLRARLTGIILLPLLTVALLAGLWQLNNARKTATDVHDRGLLSAALAVVHDVAISGGDAPSRRTRDILADTSGGPVFYHVYGPDGAIVAGYATPPVGIPRPAAEVASPTYFRATYLGRSVSGVRLQTRTEVDGFAGIFTTTVWQDDSIRTAFVRDLMLRSVIVILGLIASLALIVWFGVRVGLRPLIDLEQAIGQRSSDELSPIKRPVPEEVRGIAETLNRLFEQVSKTLTAQSEFISNAAHQLRNPIAGVLSLAEAVDRAPNPNVARKRTKDLLTAAQETSELSQKLLLFERAKAISPESTRVPLSLSDLLPQWIAGSRTATSVVSDIVPDLPVLWGDATMIREALENLIDNAHRHGGPTLSRIGIRAWASNGGICIAVCDDGKGLSAAEIPLAMERFRLVGPSSSTGLGLSIVETIVANHNGVFTLSLANPGLCAKMWFPAPAIPAEADTRHQSDGAAAPQTWGSAAE